MNVRKHASGKVGKASVEGKDRMTKEERKEERRYKRRICWFWSCGPIFLRTFVS